MSRMGLALCLAYSVASLVCIAVALTSGDDKGQFVLLQLPIALQGALIQSVGLGGVLESLSWPAAYALLALPVAVLLYFVGKFIGRHSATL